MSFTFAIVGRPNVGKSTLFNRLAGRRTVIVNDNPGITRDRLEAVGYLPGMEFNILDTPGLAKSRSGGLDERLRQQTLRAIELSDGIFFVVDSRSGITPLDELVGRDLRKFNKFVILLANKSEGNKTNAGVLEAYALGYGAAIPISAEHGEGLNDVASYIVRRLGNRVQELLVKQLPNNRVPLQLAIIGRPNVGKSTLINCLLKEERLLTGPESGLTRDAVRVSWQVGDQQVELIDTAGIRRKSRVIDRIETLSVSKTKRVIDFAETVVLLIDGENGIEKQDLKIAQKVLEEGRALVVALNKTDLINNVQTAFDSVRERLDRSLPQAPGVLVKKISAVNGSGVKELLPAVLSTYKLWNRRLKTAELNKWLSNATEHHPPPMTSGKRIKLRYVTQSNSRPPTFIIFSSRAEQLPESYVRYLVNDLRRNFDIPGVPIRMHFRRGANPYVETS